MNYRKSRALSQFDIAHNFVVSYNYEIPFRRAFSALPRRLTEGWSVNGITRFATGFPVTITQSGDRSLTGASGVDEPDFLGGLAFQDPRNAGADGAPNRYFDKDRLRSEPLGGVGNSSRRFFHGPGFNNWDFGLHKVTRITERTSLLIRAEYLQSGQPRAVRRSQRELRQQPIRDGHFRQGSPHRADEREDNLVSMRRRSRCSAALRLMPGRRRRPRTLRPRLELLRNQDPQERSQSWMKR